MSQKTTGLVHGAEDAGMRQVASGNSTTGIAAGTVVLTLDGALRR